VVQSAETIRSARDVERIAIGYNFDGAARRFVIVSSGSIEAAAFFRAFSPTLYILTYGTDLTMAGGLIIRSSSIHAAGCYTTRAVKKGQRVCEYDGTRFSKEQADERYADRAITYLFSCGNEGLVIDGFGIAMFINHSCDPNCESEDVDGRIFVMAIRDIAAGEELTYEYNLYDSDDAEGDCYCGAKQCRGTMFSEAEVKRRAKKARVR
jgi:hypothetical protein